MSTLEYHSARPARLPFRPMRLATLIMAAAVFGVASSVSPAITAAASPLARAAASPIDSSRVAASVASPERPAAMASVVTVASPSVAASSVAASSVVASPVPDGGRTSSRSCTGYTNYVAPPAWIRVLRQSGPSAGHSVNVPFRSWVKHVLGTQMPGYYPRETLRANAIFVKQYGWYYLLMGHWRGGRDSHGVCYDVKDAGDGWYVPEQRSYTPSQSQAVDATWDYTVRKWDVDHWRFFLTGYRSGAMVPCARDSDGWHLMQHSAFDCGKDGMKWRAILGKYLTKLRIVYRYG